MIWEQNFVCLLENLVEIASKINIVFLVNGLKLGMESSDNQILESIRLNLSPVIYLVAWNILNVASNILACIGIASNRTNLSHQLVVLVCHGDG